MIHWLLEPAQNMTEPPETFLSAAEWERFTSLRFEKRRLDWLLGRWTAKRLLQAILLEQTHDMVARHAIEIFNDADGAPKISEIESLRDESIKQTIKGLNLSISHSNAHAFCAVSDETIGADLEIIEPRPEYLVGDYFTTAEQAHVSASTPATRDVVVTAIWSAKEAVLKALRKGLSEDTRAVEISIAPFEGAPAEWTPFEIELDLEHEGTLRCWWRAQDGFVLALAADAPETPDEIPTTPETVLVTVGELHEGHGVLPRRIAQATRHHPRHSARD